MSQNRIRGPRKPIPGQQDTAQKDDANKKREAIAVQQKKERLKEEIADICRSKKLNGVTDIAELPEIQKLCKLMKDLTVLSKINLEDDQKNDVSLKCLLGLVEKHRNAFCNTTTCFDILNWLHLVCLESQNQDVSHLEILKELGHMYLSKTEIKQSKKTAEKLKDLAIKLGNTKMEGEAYSLLFYNCIKTDITSAKNYLAQYRKYCKESGDEHAECRVALFDAYVAFNQNMCKESLDVSEKARTMAIALHDKKMQCDVLAFQATVHCSLFSIQKSFEVESIALKIAKEIQYQKRIMQLQLNRASTYSLIGDYQQSYRSYKSASKICNIQDKDMAFTILCNLSVAALIVGEVEESLQCARQSLIIAEDIGTAHTLALAYGNIGLALEKKKDYRDAILSFEECLKYGKDLKDARIINNGYCNLGRAYKGCGDMKKAEEFFLMAYNDQPPLSAHWCDTEDFRFSADYLLGTLAFEQGDLPKAKRFFEEVVERCDRLRKNVTESKLKICFNDTQKKPYQYLQYILLQEGKNEDALMFGEKGRGRDFYDRVTGDEATSLLDKGTDLIGLVKDEAVLFLSKLDVVGKMCCWFIMPDGEVHVLLLENGRWSDVLSDFDLAMVQLRMLAPREMVEMRGIDTLCEDEDEEDVGYFEEYFVEYGGSDASGGGSSNGVCCDDEECSGDEMHSVGEVGGGNGDNHDVDGGCDARNNGGEDRVRSDSRVKTGDWDNDGVRSADSRASEIEKMNKTFAKVVDELSELVVRPIEKHLMKLINQSKSNQKPKLLIVPQGKTFNIPYGALKFENGEPLCSKIAIHETISFHAYNYHNVKANNKPETTSESVTSREEQILIVGNPTCGNQMTNLPFAQQEAEIIGQQLGVTPLTQSAATHEEVVHRLPKARIVHFACHGSPKGNMVYLTSSANDNGCLTMEEVAQMSLQADLVVLSACHSGRGSVTNEGIIGLARAFHIAGAKCVITALWAIPDKATRFFMEQFYQSLVEGVPIVHALSATMDKLRKEESYTNVTSWGSFKVLGSNIKVAFHE